MPVSAMLMTGGVVFKNYFCGGMFFCGGRGLNLTYHIFFDLTDKRHYAMVHP
jgi:hypothetical protein